ncbi:hypothetical protein KDU71_07435 [Carboxylicivirga sediminis]|uniref:Phage tail protein n=1 Tax=Carboxylicivirga sediminis TaxID=2006564 RepID=A0A941F3P9_9BACT|nr:hypothetical protein [Carboxylicivirga sediminis]MBR8535388.1 hypothetical protein [Carboxylicivirga sediminis]
MAKVNFAKIASFKTGDVMANGTMQTSLAALAGIKEGSASLNIGEPEVTDINIEESDTPFASSEGSREVDLTLEIIGAEAQQLAPLIGGTYTAASAGNREKITIGAGVGSVLKAIEFAGKNADGEDVIVSLPKTKILYSVPGTITKNDVRGWQLKCKVLQPDDGAGNLTDWMIIESGAEG